MTPIQGIVIQLYRDFINLDILKTREDLAEYAETFLTQLEAIQKQPAIAQTNA
jgi:hypothetical protein